MSTSFPAKAIGGGLTITIIVSEFSQPFISEALTIYSVVSEGNAIGLAMVSFVKLVVGDHK